MKKDDDSTEELLGKFDKLCEKYAFESIDAVQLRKGINKIIDNYCD